MVVQVLNRVNYAIPAKEGQFAIYNVDAAGKKEEFYRKFTGISYAGLRVV